MTTFKVRLAKAEDAEPATLTLRRSIVELCSEDHQNDPEILDGWLSNKTPEHFRAWLDNPKFAIVVAIDDIGALLGVGGATQDGEIILNYVSPDARLTGVSSAILIWLENWLQAEGLRHVHLRSTMTAHDFYLARGYQDNGPSVPWRGDSMAQPMVKDLT